MYMFRIQQQGLYKFLLLTTLLSGYCVPAYSVAVDNQSPSIPVVSAAPKSEKPQLFRTSQPKETPIPLASARAMASEHEEALLYSILQLKFEDSPLSEKWENQRETTLETVVGKALKNSIPIQKADRALKDAKKYVRKLNEPNPLNLLKLAEVLHYKKAAEYQVLEMVARQTRVRQRVMFESARFYEALVKSYSTKKNLFNRLTQQKSNLSTTKERFLTGEVTKLAVTRDKMALIETYQLYLKACQAYYTASFSLSTYLGNTATTAYIPTTKIQNPQLPAFSNVRPGLTLENAMAYLEKRADREARDYHYQFLQEITKAAAGSERQKRQAEANQYILESAQYDLEEKIKLQKAFSDYQLAANNNRITGQQLLLANELLKDLEVTYQAGFSSLNSLQEGRLQYQDVVNLFEQSQVSYRVNQLNLLFALGVLDEDTLSSDTITGLKDNLL